MHGGGEFVCDFYSRIVVVKLSEASLLEEQEFLYVYSFGGFAHYISV